MLEAILFLLLGLVLLVWSADRLVFGAAALARNFGISPLVIGMTILAMGSSAPEMMVSATAALEGKTDTAVGNVIGSNIANIALILGATALLKPLAISSGILKREMPLMLGVTLIAGVLLWDNHLGFPEGLFLIVLFVIFILAMIRISHKESNQHDPLESEHDAEIPKGVKNSVAGIWLVIGLLILPYSADLLVTNAVIIAKHFGMSDLVIGLTIIAFGTSLPELAASIAGVLKGEDDMAVGNIIGSNVFNILAVMAIPGILHPSTISPLAMHRDYYVMLALSIVLVLMSIEKKPKISRVEGALLISCFIAYQAYLLYNTSA
ncbi:calcium/sodium antiporter [Thaumasiovibrio sp. DFM-14]|uniref:calcium/sodium antiporter n=1 Tax=Thaumasiovibrio sp. DFM-14 TaxID=3384792 RepID=UPI0039A28D33